MLHPSTKHLIDRIGDMTANGKLDWVDRGDGTYRFETKGYGVVLSEAPAQITILTPEGKTVEQAESAVLAATPHDTEGTYESFVVNLAGRVRDRIGERQRREEADSAIKTILTGLDLDGDGVPDVYVPADEVHAVSAADAVTEATAADETAVEDDGEESRFSGAETVEMAEPEALATEPEPAAASEGASEDNATGFPTGGATFAAGAAAFGTAAALSSGNDETASESGAGAPEPETPAGSDYAPLAGLTPLAEMAPEAPSFEVETPGIDAFGAQDASTAAPEAGEAQATEPAAEQSSTEEGSAQPETPAPRPQSIAFGAGLAGTLVPDEPVETASAEPEQAAAAPEVAAFGTGFEPSMVTDATDFATPSEDVAEAADGLTTEAAAEAGMPPAETFEADAAPLGGTETETVSDNSADSQGFGFGFGAVGQTVSGLGSEASDAVGTVAEEAGQGVSDPTHAASNATDAARSFTTDLSETTGEAMDTIVGTVAGTTDGLSDAAAGFGQTAQDGFATSASAFGETVADVQETVSDNVEAAAEPAGATFGSFADAAGSTIADATGFSPAPEQPVETDAPEAIQPESIAPAPENNAASGLSSVFGGIGGAVQSAASSVGEAAGSVADEATGNDDAPAEEASGQSDEGEEVKPDNKPGGRFNPWM